ncbi:MAG TPA: acyl-CoA dehydrogenase family protein [Solirubrobacteraceae bacterium]|nr:acyl-CoA dehydrogenase family protein [Solirubrobacteraceae bacterium]
MPLLSLTDEQNAFVEAIRDFARRECGTREQRDALTDEGREPHNQALYSQIASLGWLGAAIPEAYGGAGGSAVDMCLLCEEFARGLIPMGFFPVTMMAARPVELFGSEALKSEILGGLVQGRTGAIAMSEPEAGSDVAGLSCRAVRSDGGFVLNGQKTWITGAHMADQIVVVCRTTRGEDKHFGLTMISVPGGVEGLEVRPIGTMGGREVNDMYFTDCFVPEERLVGEVDQAWMQLMAGLNNERLIIAAQSLGMAERAFEDVLAYVKERRQFGRAVGSFQTIAHRLADLAVEVEATQQLVYGVARAVEANPGRMLPREASMAKLKATELAKHAALEGMQMMGGYGYATEYDMEAHVRHTLVTTIYGGTSEIQREIIARSLGL